jgi:hypothetical protein
VPWWIALLSTADTTNSSSWINGGYGVIGIIVGVVTVIGAFAAAYKIAQRRGVEAKQTKQVIDIVLPDDKGQGGVLAALKQLSDQITELARNSQPNGGNTKSLGDTVKRTEELMIALASRLDQHIGSVNARLIAIEGQLKEAKNAKGS